MQKLRGPDHIYRKLRALANAEIQRDTPYLTPDHPDFRRSFSAIRARLFNHLNPEEQVAYFIGEELQRDEMEDALNKALERNDSYYEMATRDDLTGLPTRRTIRENLSARFGQREDELRHEKLIAATDLPSLTAEARKIMLDRREPQKKVFSVMMLDLSGFKKINDAYGHFVGDKALKMIADVLAQSLRDGDLVARWGGDEFLIVLPGVDASQHETILRRLEENFANIWVHAANYNRDIRIDTGAAIVEVQEGDTVESIQKRADQFLEASKEGKPRRENYHLTTRIHDFTKKAEVVFQPLRPEIITPELH